jgi:enoyl-CoA hydratase/carnithine racemase
MTVHYETDDPVFVITIDRPEVCNAIDRRLLSRSRSSPVRAASSVLALTSKP